MNNAVASAPEGQFHDEGLRAYDKLPFLLRKQLQDSVVNWNSFEIWRQWEHIKKTTKNSVSLQFGVVVAMEKVEVEELKRFAAMWPAKFGVYPAKAANATVMRPDEKAKGKKR